MPTGASDWNTPSEALDIPPSEFPVENVAQFEMAFADLHGMLAVRSKLNEFAKAVTKLLEDEVRLDAVGQMLEALRERKLVTGDQRNSLFHSRILERLCGPPSRSLDPQG